MIKNIICLATFNGEKYIKEQIESIQNQSVKNWSLLIRDDGSTDDTIRIINEISKTDNRITIIEDKKGNIGVIKSFSAILGEALTQNPDYIWFCDQDDVWLPNKMHAMLNSIISKNEINESTPILAHSDLRVVDQNLIQIDESLIHLIDEKYGVSPKNVSINNLLHRNYISGCACVINKKLAEISYPFPNGIIMHDWWLSLLALITGEIIYIDDKLINYRQHGNNNIGSVKKKSYINHAKHLRRLVGINKDYTFKTIIQSKELVKRVKKSNAVLKNDFLSCAEKYSEIPTKSITKKITYSLLFSKKKSLAQKILFLISI